jgi:hypothetical protein
MRVLFDQSTPEPLRHFLHRHSVDTAYERGWSALSNGDLLKAAEDASYDLFITTDQNLRYQQNLTGLRNSALQFTPRHAKEHFKVFSILVD